MRQLSVQQLAMAGMATAATAILALAGFTWNFAWKTQSAAAYVAHTHQVIGAINGLEANLYRAEAGQRAYLATRSRSYLSERNGAVLSMERGVNELAQLTTDNAAQAERVETLRKELTTRSTLYRQTEALLMKGGEFPLEQRVEMGAQVLEGIRPLIASMISEEERLLQVREQAEAERGRYTTAVFGLLVLVLLGLLPAIFFRMYRDLAARRRAEALVAGERLYDDIHARALALYNLENRREAVLEGTLSLLAENPLFPVGAFYLHEEWGGALRLVASRSAPADIKSVVRLDEGMVGTAARTQQPVYLEGFDVASGPGWRIETGLAAVAPAAMLICPVQYQSRLLGVLAMSASQRLAERDKAFVQRVAAQLAVALHNLGQLEEVTLLAEQLRSRGEDIQLKNAELEKASRLKSEFLANMSHELRTPLNAIIGFSEIMKDGLAGELPAEQHEYVSDIHSSGKHLLSLINDILDLSKVESGHVPLELETLEPLQLAASTVSMLRDRAATGHIRLVTLCPPNLGHLRADVRKCKQIVYNLVSNALKFTTDNGTVTLSFGEVDLDTIRAVPSTPDSRVFPPAPGRFTRFLEIRVTDSGIGIAPDSLRQLFQPFVQIDSSLSRQFAGTGLGLTMVKRLAELHGGGLMTQSTEGVGSTFTVWLPWRPVSADQEQETEIASPLHASELIDGEPVAPTVLVIEDDPRAVSLMRVQLQAQGYRVEFAHTAEEGLERALALRPSALVLDIILPGMDGWDLLSRLKEKPETRHIPVVIVSITDETRRGFALGAAQVLVKPVSQDDLLAALAAAGLDEPSSETRVMVVDDDPKAVTLVSKHLQVAGYTPVAAFGGQEALELARHQAPDMVILDLMMPGVSGFDVVRHLRAAPQTAEIPIIVLTAKLLTTDDRVQLQGRVQQVMEKSAFESASLLAEVKRSLVRKRMKRA
jgi:signal transduction histidine kinase/DNA-binding response OmpR family regulator/CHASE3 domain sensor protein